MNFDIMQMKIYKRFTLTWPSSMVKSSLHFYYNPNFSYSLDMIEYVMQLPFN